MLERLVHGWRGKFAILILLGFAATDFVITRTLSLADAAEHLIHNPQPTWQQALDSLSHTADKVRFLLPWDLWQRALGYWNKQLVVTVLLSILSFLSWHLFRRGITRRVLQVAVAVLSVYLLLTGVVIASGLVYLAQHPGILPAWWEEVFRGHWHVAHPPATGQGGWAVALLCLVSFPKMALGLSGFELSMVVMPLVRGDASDGPSTRQGRVRNTRKLLITAAAIMSLYLLGSALVTTTLIPPQAFVPGGPATNRALAYLAHGGVLVESGGGARFNPLCGELFGTLYDFSTVLVLGLAGTSITLGLRNLIPQYLHRLGMELDWAHNMGAILHVFNAINLAVTVLFQASVAAQRGAYATSVLVLLSSAGVASLLHWRSKRASLRHRLGSWGFFLITLLFAAAATVTLIDTPEGLAIALAFIVAIVVSSLISRTIRSTELRFEGFVFVDAQSRFLWESLKGMDFPVLVPHRPGRQSLASKEASIRRYHRLSSEIPLVFLEVELGDASAFYQKPLLQVMQEEERFILRISRGASIAHVIAAVGLEMSRVGKPPEIHFGWSEESPMAANVNFVLFGQGNVPWMVHELIRKAEPRPARRPRLMIG